MSSAKQHLLQSLIAHKQSHHASSLLLHRGRSLFGQRLTTAVLICLILVILALQQFGTSKDSSLPPSLSLRSGFRPPKILLKLGKPPPCFPILAALAALAPLACHAADSQASSTSTHCQGPTQGAGVFAEHIFHIGRVGLLPCR